MKHLTNDKTNRILKDIIYNIKNRGIPIAIGILIAIVSCNASKKSQDQKEAEARVKQIALLTEVRKQLPCDTITTFYTVGSHQSMTFDTSKSGVITITRYKTLDRVITKVVLDSALAHQRLLESFQKDYYIDLYKSKFDSTANESDKLKAENAVLSPYRTKWNWLKGIAASLAIGALIWAFRKKIVSLFTMFIK